jgi:beta-glucosidase
MAGCQSKGIAATPKHFVANDAENRRKTLTVQIDEQTLREIYLCPFQLIMKLSQPLCFMTSYVFLVFCASIGDFD